MWSIIAYGLTEGGYNAQQISLQPLGKRIVKPTEEGDDVIAKREAILKPRVVGEFLTKYSGSPLPRHDIAINVLEDMGVPKDKSEAVLSLIIDSAQTVGLLREIKEKQYVDRSGITPPLGIKASEKEDSETDSEIPSGEGDAENSSKSDLKVPPLPPQPTRRVFITHGKDLVFLGAY